MDDSSWSGPLDALAWLGRRLSCVVLGHELSEQVIYDYHLQSVMDGFQCNRCGRTQAYLRRRQEVDDDE